MLSIPVPADYRPSLPAHKAPEHASKRWVYEQFDSASWERAIANHFDRVAV